MKNEIHKFHLKKGTSVISGNLKTILSFHLQNHVPTVWVEVNSQQRISSVEFKVLFTGEPFEDGYTFLGTEVSQHSGLVFHCYYKILPV